MSSEFTELDEANRKVCEWKREARQSAPVHLCSGVDISLSPLDAQPTLPHLSRFEVLRTNDVLTKLAKVPSITSTACVSVGFGALLSLLLTFHRRPNLAMTPLQSVRSGFSRLVRLLLCGVAAVLYVRFLRRRYPVVQRVSQYQNLAPLSEDPCFVANRVLTLSNSQAGTHADGPHHFCRSLSLRHYDDAHYSGDAVVLDISSELDQQAPATEQRAITVDVMARACRKLPAALRDGTVPVWRLLLVTRRLDDCSAAGPSSLLSQSISAMLETDEVQRLRSVLGSSASLQSGLPQSRTSRPFLFPETVEYLHRVFPRLLLVGLDAPSVDPTDTLPLVNHSHRALLRCGMAVVENLRFDRLRALMELGTGGQRGVLLGSMLTVFTSTQNFDDARGCSVIFFPEEDECL